MTRNPRVSCFFWAAASTSVLFGLCGASENASASVYANGGVREKEIRVCFVGDALKSRPSQVKKFQEYMSHYQYAANVVFNFTGTCPAATPGVGGNDFYDGDIRIVIRMIKILPTDKGDEAFTHSYDRDGKSFDTPVPGKGCKEENPSSNWSNFPNDLSTFRACVYNLKIGDEPDPANPYLNNILHEVGHGLGLAHEHQRTDADKSCADLNAWCKINGCGTSSGLLTPYDRDSVMHYQFISCGINGNYDYTGLSTWDQLGVHILYPEDQQVAEFVGTTVIRSGDALSLESAWEFRGADIDTVASKFIWKLNNTTYSSSPELSKVISVPGTYQLKIDHKDFLGRSYSYSGPIRVLKSQDFIRQIAVPIPSQLPLF
jgi:hypothetical protein